MARLVILTSVLFSVCLLIGCDRVDSGKAQILPSQSAVAPTAFIEQSKKGEADIVEQMAANRQAYRRGLEQLVQYYTKTGNNAKLTWAEKELSQLNAVQQYDYIVEAAAAGPNLKASKPVSEADYMYNEAARLEQQAGQFVVFKDDNLLRMALDKYNQLISKYPSSDKIDDAAFRAAGIYEHFKDYSIAVQYYQRVYQWDPHTNYPAKFKAADILNKQLHRRAEALQLYKEALADITSSGEHREWQQYAETQVKILTGELKPEDMQEEPIKPYK
jgi:tetratricopeptide (TPR) repeat protein